MSEISQRSVSDEPNVPTSIGAGSFATVYSVPGTPYVFKVIHDPSRAAELRAECHALHTLYARCTSDSLFAVPRPIAFYNPATDDLDRYPPDGEPPIGRPRDARPLVNSRVFTYNGFNSAAYAMDRAHLLPIQIRHRVRELFYSPQALAQSAPPPRICRLYFGKVVRPSQFVNPSNFPLDVARYTALHAGFGSGAMHSAEEVVGGMGEMLSRIHWVAGYDGRDVEFVMAGAGFGVRFYVIDFNQMRHFGSEQPESRLRGLVDAFFANDPYYPRPVPHHSLYQTFRSAYLGASPDTCKYEARAFLDAIEAEYASRHPDSQVG